MKCPSRGKACKGVSFIIPFSSIILVTIEGCACKNLFLNALKGYAPHNKKGSKEGSLIKIDSKAVDRMAQPVFFCK
jgi:hypothetical protein